MSSLTRGQRITMLVAVLATAGAGVAHYAGAPSVLAFVVAGIALAALASVVSFATEQLGARFGPAVTGVLQSTLGNLPEFFIVLFALGAGQVVVAQTSVVGSLFANALLVLGAVIVVGARRDGTMRFRARLPQDTATLMLSASFIIVLVALAVASHDKAARHVDALSAIAAVCLLAIYGAWLWSYLRSDEPREEAHETHGAAVPLAVSVALLAVSGAGAAFASDWFVNALEPAIEALGRDPLVRLRTFDEVRDAHAWAAAGIPGSPFAVALDEHGTVLAKGTFNTPGQLESVLATAERRRA